MSKSLPVVPIITKNDFLCLSSKRRGGQCDHRIRKSEGKSVMMMNSKKVQERAKKSKKIRAGTTIKTVTMRLAPVPCVELTKLKWHRGVVVVDTSRASTTINPFWISKFLQSFWVATIGSSSASTMIEDFKLRWFSSRWKMKRRYITTKICVIVFQNHCLIASRSLTRPSYSSHVPCLPAKRYLERYKLNQRTVSQKVKQD